MLSLCRSSDREIQSEAWLTFGSGAEAVRHPRRFFGLTELVEVRLAPRACLLNLQSPALDIVTYVSEGAITFEDAAGRTALLQAGEVQRGGFAALSRQRCKNTSSTLWARVFQVGFFAAMPSAASDGPVLFTWAERRNLACVIASGDESGGIRLGTDARMISSVLDPGHHLVHTLAEHRGGWVQVVAGSAVVNGTTVARGDGVGVVMEPAISVRALDTAEFLLIDVARDPAAPHGAAE